MQEFLMRQFDKLLLSGLLLVYLSVALIVFKYFSGDMALMLFATGLVSGGVSALNVLITGAISKAAANPNNEPK